MKFMLKSTAIFGLFFLLSGAAWASLGDTESSVLTDQMLMKASRRVVSAAQYKVHRIQLDSGVVVNEYVSDQGLVFAVTWKGPFMPDLQQLLGKYFADYIAVASEKQSGRGMALVNQPGLVVQSGGRPRAFFGKAYLPQQLPENMPVDEIQ